MRRQGWILGPGKKKRKERKEEKVGPDSPGTEEEASKGSGKRTQRRRGQPSPGQDKELSHKKLLPCRGHTISGRPFGKQERGKRERKDRGSAKSRGGRDRREDWWCNFATNSILQGRGFTKKIPCALARIKYRQIVFDLLKGENMENKGIRDKKCYIFKKNRALKLPLKCLTKQSNPVCACAQGFLRTRYRQGCQ